MGHGETWPDRATRRGGELRTRSYGPMVVDVIVDGMAGLERKKEPAIQTIAFMNLLAGQRAQFDLE